MNDTFKVQPEIGEQIFHNQNAIIFLEIDYDSDVENPIEDCCGTIYSLSAEHNQHITLNEYFKLVKNPLNVSLYYLEHGQCKWGVGGTMNNMSDFGWDGVKEAGVFCPTKEYAEIIKINSVKHLLPEGVTVNWEGGEVTLTITTGNEKPIIYKGFKNFKCAYNKAVKFFDLKFTKSQKIEAQIKEARRVAEIACEEYTSWVNGENYWFKIASYFPKYDKDNTLMVEIDDYDDVIEQDSCGGFIGEGGLKSMIQEYINPFITNNLSKVVTVDVGEEMEKLLTT